MHYKFSKYVSITNNSVHHKQMFFIFILKVIYMNLSRGNIRVGLWLCFISKEAGPRGFDLQHLLKITHLKFLIHCKTATLKHY